jgi:hypothetical protein
MTGSPRSPWISPRAVSRRSSQAVAPGLQPRKRRLQSPSYSPRDSIRSAPVFKSINRPEANLTGVTFYSGGAIIAKQLELLRELVPNVTEMAMLVHPSSPMVSRRCSMPLLRRVKTPCATVRRWHRTTWRVAGTYRPIAGW